jgi:hypothetical protein
MRDIVNKSEIEMDQLHAQVSGREDLERIFQCDLGLTRVRSRSYPSTMVIHDARAPGEAKGARDRKGMAKLASLSFGGRDAATLSSAVHVAMSFESS